MTPLHADGIDRIAALLQNWLHVNTRQYLPRVVPPIWFVADDTHRESTRRFVRDVLRGEAPEHSALDREAAELVLLYHSITTESS